MNIKLLLLIAIIMTPLSQSSAQVNHPGYKELDHMYISFFQRLDAEKLKSVMPPAVVHIQNNKLAEVMWKSNKITSKRLIIGNTLETFFDNTTEFPMIYTEDTIAIIYQREDGLFVRKDDGTFSDSFAYDDRLIRTKDTTFKPLYFKEIIPGVESGLSKKQIKSALKKTLITVPNAIKCESRGMSFKTVSLRNSTLVLDSKYLQTKDESIKMSYNPLDKTIRFDYKLLGINGLVSGVEVIKFRGRILRQILFPQDLLFTEKYKVSPEFRQNFTDMYYPFLSPRVCAIGRRIL